jgi:hypothetical protein
MAAIGQELLNVPMGDMIRQMAFAIADAQVELDKASMYVAEMMSGSVILRDEEGNPIPASSGTGYETQDTTVTFKEAKKKDTGEMELVPANLSMLELGFTPNFYQFIDTIIEVKIAIKTSRESTSTTTTKTKSTKFGFGWGFKVTTTNVDATYSSKYNYSAEGSSLLRTKLVPVPPPAILEERIRAILEIQKG